MAELSPMLKQYLEIKEQHKNEILFFRLGDFYEMFFDDAKIASKELELTLTGRDCGLDERAPMCGIPHHSSETYIARLISKGYKVAICEQLEEVNNSKMPIQRDVIRVVTPGTIIEGSMLDESKNNFIASVNLKNSEIGICFADISTGEVELSQISGETPSKIIMDDLSLFAPKEILLHPSVMEMKDVATFLKTRQNCTIEIVPDQEWDFISNKSLVEENESIKNTAVLNIETDTNAVSALGVLIKYIRKNKMDRLEKLLNISSYKGNQFLLMDSSARRNLETTTTLRTGEKKGSLLWVLDHTVTAMGRRLLRSFVEQPLYNNALISRRLNAVEELFHNTILRSEIFTSLTGIYDLERLITRIVYGSANPKEVLALYFASLQLPKIKELLIGLKSQELISIQNDIDPLYDIADLIHKAIVDDPPLVLKDGGIIRKGYHAELDELREIVAHGKKYIADIETREREKTGIKNLKVSFNKVFGYYIEVTNSYLSQVPTDYIRKQTLVNCERFITEDLKKFEDKVLSAGEKIILLEYELFSKIREQISLQLHRIQKTASALAKLDVYCSFAEVSVKNNYCRPEFVSDNRVEIKEGRHPVVEKMLQSAPFVPNDTLLDTGENRTAIITGPNMAGKSTYMRQVALICLMAQMGCFVPAKSAKLSLVDRIFTRVGASDDLAGGQSTFMVEMSEVAYILNNATKQSLILLDEIGRGTSTYDGMSIARAVVEFITDEKKIGSKTLFATHYHELTDLEDQFYGIKNYNIVAKKRGDDVIFLRKVVRGGTDDSYGIEVAKLAGVPLQVIKRAKDILKTLEMKNNIDFINDKEDLSENDQISFGIQSDRIALEKLKHLDVTTLTPIESMNILYDLVKNLNK